MGWSIFGIVLGCIALLAVFVLLTPVHVIVKSNQEELLALSYRILCFRFGGKKKPESVGGKSLEQVLGVFQVKSGKEEGEEAKGKPISHTIDRLSKILTSLFKRVKTLLKRCRITRLHLHIVCAGEDAAAAAVEYGAVSAIVYSLLGYLDTVARIKRKATDIQVLCDYDRTEGEYSLDMVLSVRICRLLTALLGLIRDNAKKEKNR